MYKLFKRRYCPAISTRIPHKAEFQLRTENFGHKANENWRLLRRELSLFFSGQKFLECATIPEGVRRILWLAPSIKNIGDAIMALSGRELLIKAGYAVDVLLDAKVYPLFEKDEWFDQVFMDASKMTADNYDLILLDSVKSISLKTKQKYFRKTQYCHFRGHFDGVEFNWILFSYHRINTLLGSIHSQEQLDAISIPVLFPKAVNKDLSRIIIAVGGEDQLRRVYDKWNIVIQGLITKIPEIEIVLIGNANAVDDARALVEQFANNINNQVNQLSLAETADLIAKSAYFAGCDGGLMHIAVAHDLAGVALFGYFEPEYRLPLITKIQHIYDPATVKNMQPEIIVEQLTKVMIKGSNEND